MVAAIAAEKLRGRQCDVFEIFRELCWRLPVSGALCRRKRYLPVSRVTEVLPYLLACGWTKWRTAKRTGDLRRELNDFAHGDPILKLEMRAGHYFSGCLRCAFAQRSIARKPKYSA
jgi:hypothetical protein